MFQWQSRDDPMVNNVRYIYNFESQLPALNSLKVQQEVEELVRKAYVQKKSGFP
jgi:hypothetical protein